ncbi:MAG TPA: cytochrome b/b6 domain-containing protein [Terriglobia bacterium]|nr:cytochrome b/b6 domain-containing protein [Terriglobia bacterium]
MDINPHSGVELNNTPLSRGSSQSESSLLVRDDEVFIRMTPLERLQHIVLILCFVLLVLTGLPLLLDPAMWLKKLFFFENSFAWRGWIHRLAGAGLIGLSVLHLVYVSGTRRGRELFWALMPKLKDVTDALESFGHNLGVTRWAYEKGILKQFFDQHPYWLFRQPPQYGRFNFIEKFEYIAVWWGNIVMIASGFFLWATNLSFRLFPLWVYDIFKIIHSYEAILAFLAIIIWHLYNVHLTPDVFPMSRVWLDGTITGHDLRAHHPLEYEAILEARRRASGIHRDSESLQNRTQMNRDETPNRKSGG